MFRLGSGLLPRRVATASMASAASSSTTQMRHASSGADKDYYKVLGISKGASQADVKKAYRKRAMETHPDQGGKTEEFAEVSQAYEVLSDEGKRKMYDQYGSEAAQGMGGPGGMGGGGMGGFGGRSPEDIFSEFFGRGGMGGMGGFGGMGGRGRQEVRVKDIDVRMKLTLEELHSGVTKSIRVTRPSVCGECKGHGTKSGKAKPQCAACHGQGQTVQMHNMGNGMVQQILSACHKCGGTGKAATKDDSCPKCNGEGSRNGPAEVSIPIPAGCPSNVVLSVRGEGGTLPDAEPGDLNVHVEAADHPIYKRRGNDLIANMDITFSEALMGFEKPLKMLDGRTVSVHSPRGDVLQTSSVLKMSGEGMPSTNGAQGDLYVVVKVQMPKSLTDEQKEALEKAFGKPNKDANASSGNTLKARLIRETREEFEASKAHHWAQQEGGSSDEGGSRGRRGGRKGGAGGMGGMGGGAEGVQCANQ